MAKVILDMKSSIVTLFSLLLLLGCKHSQVVAVQGDSAIHKVNLEYLIGHLEQFNGKTVQTTGIVTCGFESQAIYTARAVLDSATKTFQFGIKDWPGLWLEFDQQLTDKDSSILYTRENKGRLATIQGVVDIANTGHMGFYGGAITRVRLISSK